VLDLPVGVDVKLDLYTLACRELLSRLGSLRAATQKDSRLDREDCLRRFDGVLRDVLLARILDKAHGTDRLLELLRPQISLMRDLNDNVADIFDAVALPIEAKAPGWCFRDDLAALHKQGRDAAVRFYDASGHGETRNRLTRTPPLEFRYEASGGSVIDEHGDAFGYGVIPAAFHPKREVLVVRFTLRHDFGLYLTYPFLFLHEYTAHIYGTDHGNQRFNDGWMLHAAEAFFKQEGDEDATYDSYQLDAFNERLYQRLTPIPRATCRFVRTFHGWLDHPTRSPARFWDFTYELAAFQPEGGTPRSWPDRFINSLEAEYEADKYRPAKQRRLAQMIKAAASARELATQLPSV
jgi:hypothetical protein